MLTHGSMLANLEQARTSREHIGPVTSLMA